MICKYGIKGDDGTNEDSVGLDGPKDLDDSYGPFETSLGYYMDSFMISLTIDCDQYWIKKDLTSIGNGNDDNQDQFIPNIKDDGSA